VRLDAHERLPACERLAENGPGVSALVLAEEQIAGHRTIGQEEHTVTHVALKVVDVRAPSPIVLEPDDGCSLRDVA